MGTFDQRFPKALSFIFGILNFLPFCDDLLSSTCSLEDVEPPQGTAIPRGSLTAITHSEVGIIGMEMEERLLVAKTTC